VRIHHVAVVVTDLARAEAFYCGLLGLAVIRRWDDEQGNHRSTWVAVGDAFLALERGESSHRAHCVALAIDRSERERWRALLPIERESPYSLYFRDPDGNLIALSHYPEG
jgi:glyoxylase I family protein